MKYTQSKLQESWVRTGHQGSGIWAHVHLHLKTKEGWLFDVMGAVALRHSLPPFGEWRGNRNWTCMETRCSVLKMCVPLEHDSHWFISRISALDPVFVHLQCKDITVFETSLWTSLHSMSPPFWKRDAGGLDIFSVHCLRCLAAVATFATPRSRKNMKELKLNLIPIWSRCSNILPMVISNPSHRDSGTAARPGWRLRCAENGKLIKTEPGKLWQIGRPDVCASAPGTHVPSSKETPKHRKNIWKEQLESLQNHVDFSKILPTILYTTMKNWKQIWTTRQKLHTITQNHSESICSIHHKIKKLVASLPVHLPRLCIYNRVSSILQVRIGHASVPLPMTLAATDPGTDFTAAKNYQNLAK